MVTRRKQTVISTMQDFTPMSSSTTNTDIWTGSVVLCHIVQVRHA